MRFSVITVCLNAAAHIAETIESVLAQGREDCEFVVVDGGSTDGTLEIVRGYQERFTGRLRLTSEPDEGLYDAMNKGLRTAEGDYVAFLGADDRLAPGALDAVDRAAKAAAATGDTVTAGEEPTLVMGATDVFSATTSWHEHPIRVVRRGLPQRAPARHQSIFAARAALCALDGFDTRYPIAADYDLYLRLLEAGGSEVLIEQTLSEFRLGGVSSRNALATARDYRDVRIAHGAGAFVESAVMWKSAAAATVHAAWARVARRGAAR